MEWGSAEKRRVGSDENMGVGHMVGWLTPGGKSLRDSHPLVLINSEILGEPLCIQ